MTILHFRLFQGKSDLAIWWGGGNHTDTKSNRYQIGLGNLGGRGKSYRHQIIQTPNHTDTKSDLVIWGMVNHTDTKSYIYQIGLGNLGGGGKSYRHQIIQTPNCTDTKLDLVIWEGGGVVNHTDTKLYRYQIIQTPNYTDTKSPSICMIWCLYNLVSVWFGVCMIYHPPNHQVWFGICTIWCLYDLVSVRFTPPANRKFWAKFQTPDIMLCFTKVFSAKDQSMNS